MESRVPVASPKLGFKEAVKNVLSNLTNVSGRARRSEYWWYALATTVVSGILSQIFSSMPLVNTIISIIISLSMVAVAVRRVHDSGKNAIWVYIDYIFSIILLVYLYASGFYDMASAINPNPNDIIGVVTNPVFGVSTLISLITGIVVFIFCLFDSDMTANKYGESPKYTIVEESEE